MSMTPDIAAIADKIQDRANQLDSERAVLGLVQAECNDQQQILDGEIESYEQDRQTYLLTLRSRHGIELEYYKIQDQKKDCVEATTKMEYEIQQLEEEKEGIQTKWETTLSTVISHHYIQQEIYRRSCIHDIDNREQQTALRSRQLFVLATKIDNMHKTNDKSKQEEKQIEAKLIEMKQTEQEEEEETLKIAEQIRQAVQKVNKIHTNRINVSSSLHFYSPTKSFICFCFFV